MANDSEKASDGGRELAAQPGDVFAQRAAFPDGQSLFDFQLATLEAIKDGSFIALDASVLLMPFKMDKVSLSAAAEVYKRLTQEGRLVIPAQAAREFSKNRSALLGDIVKYLRDQASRLGTPLSKHIGLLLDDDDYKEAKKISDEIASLGKKMQPHLLSIVDRISSNVTDDPVSNSYRLLFKDCVHNEPLGDDAEARSAFAKDLKARYEARRPPGYKDSGKPDAGAGDLLIWLTILDVASKKGGHCIFVTADEKSDWYSQVSGPFQPRIELIEEYRVASKGGSLQIIPLSRLLEIYGASKSAVDDARRVENLPTKGTEEGGDRQSQVDWLRSELVDALNETEEINRRAEALQQQLDGLGYDLNESLSLPWNRQKHAMRSHLAGLGARHALVNVNIERLQEELRRLSD
jgi:hypothetical protein